MKGHTRTSQYKRLPTALTPASANQLCCYLRVIFIFFVFFALGSTRVNGQTKKLHFHHLNTTNGLSQSFCSFVYKDSYGFIWISSTDGLMQYDGQSFRTFHPQEGNPRSMYGKNVQSGFFEDNVGDIWFSTYDAVNVYRRETDDFDHFFLNKDDKELKDVSYCVLFAEPDKPLWLRVKNEVYWVWPDSTQSLKHYQYAGVIMGKRVFAEKSPSGRIHKFYSYDRYTSGANGFWEYLVEKDSIRMLNHFFIGEGSLPALKINALNADDAGILWLATNEGLVRFDKKNNTWKYCNNISANQTITLSEGLAEDIDHKLWVSTNLGLALFDKTTERYVSLYPPVTGGPDGPVKSTSDLYLDSSRVLWCTVFGTGIDYTALNKPKFEVFPIPEVNGQPFIPGSIAQDATGDMWFGSNLHFLKKYSPGNPNHWEEIPDKVWKIANIPQKRLLIATMDSISYVWDPLSKTRYPVKTDRGVDITFGDIFTNRSNEVLGVPFEDKGGVWRIEPATNQYVATRIDHDLFQYRYTAVYEDRLHQLYLAKEFTTLEVYKRDGNNVASLRQMQLRGEAKTFYEDDVYVWVGGEFGLCRINKQDLSEKLFQEADGLPNSMVYGILPDKNRQLWLSTNRGIICYQQDSLKFKQYSLADGLQDFEFNTKSYLKTTDGRFWFGGTKGMNVFKPEKIQVMTDEPVVRITNLLVNDQPYDLHRNITLVDSLIFPYELNTISLDFVALEYSDPANNKLQYRLFREGDKPYDDNWVSCKTAKGFARYANLPHGVYMLKIRGANSDGVWTSEPKLLYIKIKPPFYLTTEFFLFAFLVIVGTGYLIVRAVFRHQLNIKNLQLREQRLQLEKQEALTQERNRIASEMHDDFGSGLTAIQRISEYAAANTPTPEAKKAIENITTYSLELISNMREIIWAMSGKNDTLENLMAYISENSDRYLSNHHIEVDIQQPDEIPDVEMTGERRRNIYLAVKESLHNVVKHAKATAVTVRFEMNGTLDIHVRDNGKGFTNENLAGNGMTNMAKRMADIGGKMHIENNGGAHLTFSVPIESK